MTVVLDSSVILAIIRAEPGTGRALELSSDAVMSAVNLAEVVTKCIEKNYPESAALDVIESRGIVVVPFDDEQALLAGQLRRRAPRGVLSVGDRACIATAIRSRATAVTTDRIWTTLDLGCPVELIR